MEVISYIFFKIGSYIFSNKHRDISNKGTLKFNFNELLHRSVLQIEIKLFPFQYVPVTKDCKVASPSLALNELALSGAHPLTVV